MRHLGTWNDDYSAVTGYLGFELNTGSNSLYGWVNLTMYHHGSGTINSFGMETNSGTGIKAGATVSSSVPEPSTLGLLALGAFGVASIRRRSTKQNS